MRNARFLWELISYRPASASCRTLFMLACYGERIVFGLAIQAFFNTLPQHTQMTPELFVLFLPWLIAIAVRLIVVNFGTIGAVRFEFSAQALLQHNLFKHILQRPGFQALPDSVGNTISSFRDDTAIVVELLSHLGETCALIIYTSVVFIILLRVNVLITLLVFLPLCCIVVLARQAQKGLEKYRRASRTATSNVTGAIGEIFGAVQAIQVAGAEQHVVAHFHTLNAQRRASMVKDRMLSGALDALFGNVGDIGTALILVLAALSLTAGQIRPGDLVIFLTYLAIVSDFFTDIGSLLAQQTQARISFERMTNVIHGMPDHQLVAHHALHIHDKVNEESAPPAVPQPVVVPLQQLVVRDLCYRYPETGRGIAGINICIQGGTLTVITGRIGAGKTTLLHTLLGLVTADAGEITWNERPVADAAAFFIPQRSAYTAQVPHLFSDTLRENILLGLPEHEHTNDLSTAIHTAVLDHDIAALEHGLDTRIGVRGVKLSGGQIQRVAAARMLVRQPALIVCDDLSSALDIETEQLLWDRLRTSRTQTCIAISHRRSVLQRADQIIVLKQGQVEAAGSLEQLLTTSQEMQRIWQGSE
ncbi:HlyB/MsbA family ABC transporter [Dictyobacter vulcani]|uniref:HlyB/MsbA family ABC transporter n=1 Tax=Dictyobacter vulcani TaxID=2607529 RepID=A0A5J4KFZ6_9CHLR|nr:ABC transporter ATP-binding protein [Dictyobacter vulcani]GER86325.1 HlyB/MsbA family ABC transporter [Dictyobacter vulcani]